MNEWISVKERPPTTNGAYLCWYRDGFGNMGRWVGHWDCFRNGFYPKWPENPSRIITHWMELPNPPKEE